MGEIDYRETDRPLFAEPMFSIHTFCHGPAITLLKKITNQVVFNTHTKWWGKSTTENTIGMVREIDVLNNDFSHEPTMTLLKHIERPKGR